MHGCRTAGEVPDADRQRLVALAAAGRYADLEHEARDLLKSWPASGVLWQLLGIALGRQGQDPLSALQTAAQCSPADPAAHLNLGNALGRRGQLAAAEASFRQALAIRPDSAEALSNLGALQAEQGQLAEAVSTCRRALGISPALAGAHHTLGKALLAGGQPAEAVTHCCRALELQADFAEAHNSLGNAHYQLGRFDDAIASFRDALAASPDFAEAHANLGNALRSIGHLDEAVACYRLSVMLNPDFHDVRLQLATALRLQRQSAEAEGACRQVLEARPDSAAAYAVLAELRADAGRFAEAEALFRQSAAIEPDSTEAWAGIPRTRRMTAADAAWLEHAQRLAASRLSPPRELLLRYAMGKYFDDLGEFDNAFAQFRRGNELERLRGPRHDRGQLTHTVDLIIRSHDHAWFERRRSDASESEQAVLIVGVLRSGTSLVEQILASHPDAFGAGEQEFWAVAMAAAISAAVSVGPTGLALDDSTLVGMGERYLEVLRRLGARSVRIIDKLPTNFFSLGLIHAALPRARIIHVRRDPIDTCLSIYFQHLEAVNSYASDLEDLEHYYGEYRRLMDHWQSVLPCDAMLVVPYEALVEDPVEWTRRVLEFVGLPWDPRCLDSHRTERAVVTASKWQVRQRINTGSVGRWRNYAKHLGPLRSLRATD